MMRLSRAFFGDDAPAVARALLGTHLVRRLSNGAILRGRIVETEAYHGPEDTACHARMGRTERNFVMFGEGGRAYIYLIYGMYQMLNLSTSAVGFPAAVLIRAVEPLEGFPERSDRAASRCSNGPGKLCRAFEIDRRLNDEDVVFGERLWIEAGSPVDDILVGTSPRIGIDYAAEVDRLRPWRIFVRDNPWVSRPATGRRKPVGRSP